MNKRELYRDTVNGKITGVCAGLANYFALEVWLVRILVISAALLGGSFLVILAYIAMTLMIEKQPPNYVEAIKTEQEHKLKNKPWQQGQTPEMLLNTIEKDFHNLENQIRDIEAYVTSDAFKVDKEFKTL
ncbi:envelope stress response membrane protein PspC [Vibrio europaeus]|jgi:phage shock protein C|uniref:Envelope stress response membrane protein PspC n=2 Tax=Vibrio oreintalis group TaxID=1891919 RepID=A0A178JD01_9VIBR|nr:MULTISPECIES: envelope stress response membrane protein PspC [Vibrio oreintalis group]MDC5703874.1 envelope stress response membrane protein PspC [Vibrio europaeus]MDC5708172.1 envelope stress response membrane protein PspC [Vibrio europaeus]MDC5714421.1 envelope stress response membrane protein PspC [Vibrio europaeus]MDC5722622.1 envelope stress response membrane protein PspC [Vibrio europaeus]MDC5727077.1 envelope stress response membrane protein PspC [Vibrio europaeus]